MHKRNLLAAFVAAAAIGIASPAISHAQQTQTSKGEVATTPSFGTLISAINSASAHNAKLTAMTDLTAANVQLVNVEDLLKGENVEALNNALTKNEADITTLRATLDANKTISGLLATTTPTASATATTTSTTATPTPLTSADVIATDVGADGKVIVYYWKKSQ